MLCFCLAGLNITIQARCFIYWVFYDVCKCVGPNNKHSELLLNHAWRHSLFFPFSGLQAVEEHCLLSGAAQHWREGLPQDGGHVPLLQGHLGRPTHPGFLPGGFRLG